MNLGLKKKRKNTRKLDYRGLFRFAQTAIKIGIIKNISQNTSFGEKGGRHFLSKKSI